MSLELAHEILFVINHGNKTFKGLQVSY